MGDRWSFFPASSSWLGGRVSLTQRLSTLEDRAIVRALGSLAFVRSQGRTLEEGSQSKVLDVLWDVRRCLDQILTREDFDAHHDEWVARTCEQLRTSAGNELAFGQGQKTLNVFLKFYVAWASRPRVETAARLRPWLHCPLDKRVMEWLRSWDAATWRARIWQPFYSPRGVPHQQRASMSKIDGPAYRAWQDWIRELVPESPVLLDVIWSLPEDEHPRQP